MHAIQHFPAPDNLIGILTNRKPLINVIGGKAASPAGGQERRIPKVVDHIGVARDFRRHISRCIEFKPAVLIAAGVEFDLWIHPDLTQGWPNQGDTLNPICFIPEPVESSKNPTDYHRIAIIVVCNFIPKLDQRIGSFGAIIFNQGFPGNFQALGLVEENFPGMAKTIQCQIGGRGDYRCLIRRSQRPSKGKKRYRRMDWRAEPCI